MAEIARTAGSRIVVVALDATVHGVQILESAAAIAEWLRVDLKAVLVEDESLFRLANLPFAREVNRTSGVERTLDAVQLRRLLRARLNQFQHAIDRFTASAQLRAQLQVVRGHYLSAALSATSSTDVLYLGHTGRRPATFDTYRMTRTANTPATRSVALYRCSERGACHVIYTGTKAAARALEMAANLPSVASSTLSVLIAPASARDAAHLREDALKALAGLSVDVRFLDVPALGGTGIVGHLRRCGCGLLILPRGHGEVPAAQVMDLLEGLDCPVVLVG